MCIRDRVCARKAERRSGRLRMVRFEALEEIEDAGLLAGVRALARAVFKAQAWRRHGDRPECLYRRREAAGATKFILVVEVGPDKNFRKC